MQRPRMRRCKWPLRLSMRMPSRAFRSEMSVKRAYDQTLLSRGGEHRHGSRSCRHSSPPPGDDATLIERASLWPDFALKPTSAVECPISRYLSCVRTGHRRRTRQLRRGRQDKPARRQKISSFPPSAREKSDRHTSALPKQDSNPFQIFCAFASKLLQSWHEHRAGDGRRPRQRKNPASTLATCRASAGGCPGGANR